VSGNLDLAAIKVELTPLDRCTVIRGGEDRQ
jgi:hypothetical protein